MKRIWWLFVGVLLSFACRMPDPGQTSQDLDLRARELAQALLIVDTHIDTPTRLLENWEDISVRTTLGEFDFVRAGEGGLNGAFMSIYTPARYDTDTAASHADKLIDMVESFERRWPDKFALAKTPQELEVARKQGKFALAMGMENGSPVGEDLGRLAYYYDRGIRYITLAHSLSNQLSDSSYDPNRRWQGLSPTGREAVLEMNRLGIMVDVSHVSDQAFDQVLAISRAPVIASHSSCRYFTPGFERNLSDDMIRKLAQNGGVIQINFGAAFLDGDYQKASEKALEKFNQFLNLRSLAHDTDEARQYWDELKAGEPRPQVKVAAVADHIDHLVRLVGMDYVGLGSDFDGVDGELPEGLSDASQYPNLIRELLSRGYREEEIGKICSGNLVRVWKAVDAVAWSSQ
jgi:membrane dipeptidase